MIRINLLPKERQRRAGIKVPMAAAYGGIGAIVVLAGLGYYWYRLDQQIDQLKGEVSRATQELKRYENEIKRVNQFKADKQRLEERLKIVGRLAEEQVGPVRLLDQVSRALPEEVWLTAMNKTRERLVLQGYAFSNTGIANFMTELQKLQPTVKNVDLTFTEKAVVERVPVERFEITAGLGG